MTASTAHRTPAVIGCSLFIVLCTAVTAYYHAFARLATYDDEGTMMWSVKHFLEGRPLYDNVATIYGPLYYFYERCAHVLTGTPLTHHSVRLVSIAFWVTAALIVFLLTYRATGSLLVAALAHLLAFCAMSFIGDEPAHPQEACTVLLAALGLACFARDRTWRALALGTLAGLAFATKINFGIFAVVALSAGLAYSLRPKWLRFAASILASAGILVLPVLLMWGHLRAEWALTFCVLVVLSLASTILVVSCSDRDDYLDFGGLLAAVMGFAGAIAVLCWFALVHGSTMRAMVDWLIVKPRANFGQVWYLPLPMSPLAPLWAVVALALAYCVRTGRVRAPFLAFVKMVFAVAVIALGATNCYEALINFALPLLWLAAVPSGKAGLAARDSSARALLSLLAVTQALYAYPVAGSQLRFATILMFPIAAICLSDGLKGLEAPIRGATVRELLLPSRTYIRWAASLLLGAAYLGLAWYTQATYATFVPLGFPGTASMRIRPDRAAALHAVVAEVNARGCRTLVTEPGLFSFNFFTGKPAPAGLTNGAWMISLTAADQENIVREVARDPDACVIRRQDTVDFWTRHGDVSSQPLVRYINQNFLSALDIGKYSVLVRKD